MRATAPYVRFCARSDLAFPLVSLYCNHDRSGSTNWREKYFDVANMLAETRAELDDFQHSSKELEEELERELERTERAQEDLKNRIARAESEREDWKVVSSR